MKMKLNIRNRYFLLGDLFLIVVSVVGSYVLRLELDGSFNIYLPSTYWMIGIALLIKPVVYYSFGLYRRLWLYAGTQELKIIVAAVTTASILVSLAMIALFSLGAFTGFPRSVLVIDWTLSVLVVGGMRFTLRLLADNQTMASSISHSSRAKNVLIVGAGDAGALIVRELQRNPQLNLIPIGFLDDNPNKQQQQIYGIPIIGTTTDLNQALLDKTISEVLIAIPSAPGRIVRLVADVCRKKGIPFRTMPGLYELLGGKVSISRLREVDIIDLLRREPTHIRDEQVGAVISGKSVLVTGAGGSIGGELCRQIARWSPSNLLLLGHGENSIFETYIDIKENFPSVMINPLIADVRDLPRLQSIFDHYRPQVIFHAAAHKHVPLMEINVEEAVTNNILGTRNIVKASISHEVEQLVMISTDKAVRPANIMGATKRIAEMVVLDAAEHYRRSFAVVRFGNVLGSRGSVVPLFKRQIAMGGPITITHPEMKRYFMTIPEAVYLVLQAASLEEGGETFVLNMGQQVRILDLAEDLIRLSGLEPGRDVEIIFTGIRPGEKLSEDLWNEDQSLNKTPHPDIYQVDESLPLDGKMLIQSTDELIKLAREGDTSAIMHLLDELIPGAAILSTPPQTLASIP